MESALSLWPELGTRRESRSTVARTSMSIDLHSGRTGQNQGTVSMPGKDGPGMAEKIQSFDWSATSLGDAESWPVALKAAVQLMVNSRFPMFVWWGPDL